MFLSVYGGSTSYTSNCRRVTSMVVCRCGVTVMMIDTATVVMYIDIIVVTNGWVNAGICIDAWVFMADSSVGVVTSGALYGKWRVMNNKGRHVLIVHPCIAVVIAVSNTIVNHGHIIRAASSSRSPRVRIISATTATTITTTNMVSISISMCVDDGYVLLKQLILLLDVCMCL